MKQIVYCHHIYNQSLKEEQRMQRNMDKLIDKWYRGRANKFTKEKNQRNNKFLKE